MSSDSESTDPAPDFWRTEIFKLLKIAGLKGRQAVYLAELAEKLTDEKMALNNRTIESIGDQILNEHRALKATVRAEISALEKAVTAMENSSKAERVTMRWLWGITLAILTLAVVFADSI